MPRLATTILGMLLVGIAGVLLGRMLPQEQAASQVAAVPALPVLLPTPTLDDGFVAVLQASESIELRPRGEGRLEQVLVRLGDRVTRGQLIAVIDGRLLKRELAIAEAQLVSAKVEKEKTVVALERARDRYARRRSVAEIGGAAGEDVETARFEVRSAEAQVASATAAIDEKSARVAQLRDQLSDTEIRAPFDGAVVARFVDPGALVGSSTAIARLIREGEIWVRFAIPAERRTMLAVGDEVRVVALDLATPAQAQVEKIAAEIDTAARITLAEARLRAPPSWANQLLSGRAARVFLQEHIAPREPPR